MQMPRHLLAALSVLSLSALSFTAAANAAPSSNRIGDVVMGEGSKKTVTVILSLSCVFCRALDSELFPSRAADLVRRGYAIEIIPVSNLPIDTTATAVMRCGSDGQYLRRMKRIYASFSMISRMDQEKAQSWFIAREADFGFKKGELAKCFTPQNLAQTAKITSSAKARYNYEGTPTIYVNDVKKGHTIDDLP